jgi:DnaJ-class molecular chaperone
MTMVLSNLRYFLLFLVILLVAVAAEKNYYQVLEVDKDASLKDIKKGYRRLALEHHPDRNRGNEKEAEIMFRDISEAYEVLSDKDSRREYDRSFGRGSQRTFQRQHQRSSRHRDARAQFNDLFQNDEFFKSASEGMEGLFKEIFENGGTKNSDTKKNDAGEGWGSWLSKHANIQYTSSSNINGRKSHTSYGSGGGSYTSKSTRTVIENGKRITIQSMEKDGNKIEEKYIGEELIERRINGAIEKQNREKIGAGQEF